MNLTTYHVAPEEVMAFLDGELSAADTQSVSTHIDDCPECAKIADQLRRTSQTLSAWKVPPIPGKVEKAVIELADKKESGLDIGKPRLFIGASFWTGRQYAVVSLGAVSVLIILLAALTPQLQKRSVALSQVGDQISPYLADDRYKSKSAGGDRDKLQTDGRLQDVLREPVAPAPMIARAVSLAIVSKDFASARSSLDAIVSRYEGYAAQLNVSSAENAPRSLQASLRIPAPRLGSAIADLKTLGRVENESQSGEEVTRQHADLVARLTNARDTEQRLREILQQRTGKISDVLKVEEEIARVRGEIEEMEGEQKALEHRVDFATVELQLREEYKAELNPPNTPVSTRIHNAFVAGYHNVSETVLGIILFFAEYGPSLLIWLAILTSPFIFVWRRYRRIRATV